MPIDSCGQETLWYPQNLVLCSELARAHDMPRWAEARSYLVSDRGCGRGG